MWGWFKLTTFLRKISYVLSWKLRAITKYRDPSSVMCRSQSQSEDIVAHTFLRFQDVVYSAQWIAAWSPRDAHHGKNSLMPAFARSTGCRIQMDHPLAFPNCILSVPTPALEKLVLLSHSVTLVCHFLWNNWIFVTTKTIAIDVTNMLEM